jgi:hypothetical protein
LFPEKAATVALDSIESPLSAREIVVAASREHYGYIVYSFPPFVSFLLQKIKVLFDFLIPPAFRFLFIPVTPYSPGA